MAATALGAEMAGFLSASGVRAAVCEHRPDTCPALGTGSDRVGFGPGPGDKPDLVVVLGGDGTFIAVARGMLGLGVPFVGVNLGRVGFLAQLARDRWKPWLQAAIGNGVSVSSRLALRYDVVRGGGVVHSGLAVNDIVVGRGVLARLVRLGLAYGGIDVASFRADGLIIATPTGSSAYGASAGGPLVHADLFAYCVTAVCPFLSGFKPMVLPATGECAVRVEDAASGITLTEDGQASFALETGDEVRVGRSPSDLLVVDMGPRAYFEKLKRHGFLTEK
ncbi:NAD(+)/NADH kinase [Pseudodesulfovibrio aespoeensis]|uniref:NAD(+)/NADH kinase n=1 Tax=Pseudodesulfovibrio aespoeensis TaxID=182210 RepID=UPI0003030E85